MGKAYTINEAIDELDAIRMEAACVPSSATLGDQTEKLSKLLSELASVMSWCARHMDEFESEVISDILFDTEDGPVKKSELFSDIKNIPDLSKKNSEKPTVEKTERGFQIVRFLDRYDCECHLQQSSVCDAEYMDRPGWSAIWIGRGNERAHLSREQVKWVVDYLKKWLETGSFENYSQ